MEQPKPLDICILNGSVVFLEWRVQYEPCDLPDVDIRTMKYLLHPSNHFIPDQISRDVNVTENRVCNSGRKQINITLSIHLNEYILEHVPYIVCIITRYTGGDTKSDQSEKLYLQANRNCFSTIAGEDTTYYDRKSVNATMEPQFNNSACSPLSCKRTFINILHTMCVFTMMLLAVLE